MKHLAKTTPDGTRLTLDALYQIAPSCFTEAKGEDGEIHRVVDFNKLRLLLGDQTVEDAPEVYDFTWVGKRAALQEAAAPINKTLRPCPEESVDWDKTQNLYIEGDNLEVLKLLQNSYMGKVKIIYIDPPYNTGNDFLYHDDFFNDDYDKHNFNEEGERLYSKKQLDITNKFKKNIDSNGRFHSDWCSMIYARLMVARSLLTEDGSIFISIDDHEVANMKKICEEVFGENNFVSDFIRKTKSMTGDEGTGVNIQHENLLCFAKNKEELFLIGETKEFSAYSNPDNDKHGDWTSADPSAKSGGDSTYFPIENPYTKRKDYPPKGRYWAFSKTTLQEYINSGRIVFKKDYKESERGFIFKRYKDGLTSQYNAVNSLFATENIFMNSVGTKELLSILNGNYFSNPKPQILVQKIIYSINDKNTLVLDFFSGSATTAHAVMQLNAEDGGNRKFIMVQLPEETAQDSEAYKAGYTNICEIGKERIRRAGKKIKLEHPEAKDLDTGFRVFKCESSNYKDVAFAPKEYSQEMLLDLIDNIKEDRTDLDLLFDCMRRWGVELSLPLSSQKVDGCTIHNVNDGDLVACFDGKVTESVIDAIAALSPVRVVFRDNSFDEAANKMNLFELFKQKCDWTDEEVRNNIRVI